ncbi:stalk domain-containing protein [Brevibacillus dissolubilis]|uniref:stalk domain-containing protein n=1 Tax=Brevibacillus dissolubilis TaxID=1844116 RepID=UPI00210006D7|nr:stalk domain-containing protein [Brevibacillus dissolubilis]
MLKRKSMALLLAAALLPTGAYTATEALAAPKQTVVQTQPIQVQYNGKGLAFPDQKPLIRNSRTLVPIRPIAESLGFKVTWNNTTRTVSISKGVTNVQLVIDKATAKKNNESLTLDAPATIVNQRTMVPVRFIAEALNYAVNWDNTTRTVKIADRQVYGRIDNVVVYQDEADKQLKAFTFIFFGSKGSTVADLYKSKVADDTLFGRYLIAKYSDKVKVSTKVMDEMMALVNERTLDRHNGDAAALKREMQTMGITEQDVRDFAYLDLFTTEYVRSQITDAEISAYHAAHKEDFITSSVRHILVDTEEQAKAAIARLNKGEKFADLAKELSTDPGSKDNGGLYENAVVSQWVPEFKNAVLTQTIGQVGQPVKSQFGYHIILVENRVEHQVSNERVREAIMRELVEAKTKEVREEIFKKKTK